MNLPIEFEKKMKAFLGNEWDDFLYSYDNNRFQALRFNTLKVQSPEERMRILKTLKISSDKRVSWANAAYYFDENVRPGKHPYHEMGLYYIQEPSAMSAAALLAPKPGMRVLDMCTGSGCIIISILKNTTNVDGAACDISKQALNVAKENARLNGVFVDFERSDLFEHVDEMYDVIVSNPPYIRSDEIPHLMPEVSVFEPHEALDGSEDGLLFYRRIIKDCRANLKPQGRLLFEIGCDQGRQVSEMMQFAGFSDVHVIKDLAGNDRVVSGVFDSKEEKHV